MSESSIQWRPLNASERRVAGVLVEKAKTTPDAYPLSLNAVRTGCNQKSNRHPLMRLEEDEVEEALDDLREKGAVMIVQGGGRVARYKHLFYEWLEVENQEIAVVAELLLRGPQTVGELRGRAARMEPIAGLSELRPILDSLTTKGLLISLTPEGRGQVVTHGLYLPEELAQLQAEYSGGNKPADAPPAERPPRHSQPSTPRPAAPAAPPDGNRQLAELRTELTEVKSQMSQLRADFDEALQGIQRSLDELYELKRALE